MYRVCLTKEGKLIEMQSGGRSEDKELETMRLNTLKINAINQGYKENEIEVKWVDEVEWQAIQAELNKPTPEQVTERKRETLIQAKIREQAIAGLVKEGKLTA